jgi:hypothetical protein
VNRIILAIVLMGVPATAQAGKYYHGQVLTHDATGKAYTGGYYKYNAKTYVWDWYPEQKIVQNTYIYDYSTKTANQGTSHQGIHGAFRYEDFDVGAPQYDASTKYVESAHDIDSKNIEYQRTRSTQSAYTRDKLANAQAFSMMTESAHRFLESDSGQAFFQAFTQHVHSQGGSASSNMPTGNVQTAYAKCLGCHGGDAVNGGGFKFPSEFGALSGAQKDKIYAKLIIPDPAQNMAVRAKLSGGETKALLSEAMSQ